MKEGTNEFYELHGFVEKWRMIAVHPTIEKATADFDDYREWAKDAVAAWKGFRIVRVIEHREEFIEKEIAL
jgi:hypothetical protein